MTSLHVICGLGPLTKNPATPMTKRISFAGTHNSFHDTTIRLILITKFYITFFADNTYLSLAAKNLSSLEHRVNEELSILNGWFCKNKFSINHTKTNYLLINKVPHKPVNRVFKLSLNGSLLRRVSEVKYLGICIDDAYNWSSHTKHLTQQIAKYSGMFYRLRNYIQKTLCALYYSQGRI